MHKQNWRNLPPGMKYTYVSSINRPYYTTVWQGMEGSYTRNSQDKHVIIPHVHKLGWQQSTIMHIQTHSPYLMYHMGEPDTQDRLLPCTTKGFCMCQNQHLTIQLGCDTLPLPILVPVGWPGFKYTNHIYTIPPSERWVVPTKAESVSSLSGQILSGVIH